MLDDLTKATTAHGLHSTKTKLTSSTTSKRGRGNTVAVQDMNIVIPPLEEKIKYLGQLITFKNAVQVEFEHRAWATFTSDRQELTSPEYPLRDRLKLFDATVKPSILCASCRQYTSHVTFSHAVNTHSLLHSTLQWLKIVLVVRISPHPHSHPCVRLDCLFSPYSSPCSSPCVSPISSSST